jgi:hypothetical protein
MGPPKSAQGLRHDGKDGKLFQVPGVVLVSLLQSVQDIGKGGAAQRVVQAPARMP